MKRGLIKYDPEETSRDRFEARVADVQQALSDNGCAAAFIYGDVSRSGDLGYLTNFCLYWNEAVLAVPAKGRPTLVMKLSKRVNPWIEQTTIIKEIASGPKVADNLAKFLDDSGAGRSCRVAVVDKDWWPETLLKQIEDEVPDAELVDMPALVREARRIPDAEELALLADATRALKQSLKTAWETAAKPDDRVSATVRESRMAGFVDADVTSETLADGSSYIAVNGQYRYTWVRLCEATGGAMADAANAALDAAVAAVSAGSSEDDVSTAVASALAGHFKYSFAMLSHTEIETGGGLREADAPQRPVAVGDLLSVSLTLQSGDGVCMVAAMLQVTADGVRMLGQA